MMHGLVISFEGGEGGGKSTQVNLLVDRLTHEGHEVIRVTEEISTSLVQELRALRLSPAYPEITQRTEMLLAAASRGQQFETQIAPALKAKKIVVVDRFIDSMIVYDHYVGGIPMVEIREVLNFALRGTVPDLTFLLDVSPVEGLARQQNQNRMELKGLEYHRRVREGYLAHAKNEWKRFRILDAHRSRQEISEEIMTWTRKLIEEKQRTLT